MSAPGARRTAARRVGGALAGLLVAGFILWGVLGGWSKASAYPWHLDPSVLVASVVVLVAFNLAWGAGYVGLVETMGPRPPRLRMFSIWGRSVLARYVPGNVMMIASRVVLGREAGVPGRISLGASVYEQLAMLAPAALAGAVFLVAEGARGWSPLFWLVLVVPFGLVLLDPAVLGTAGNWLLARLGRDETLAPLRRGQVVVALVWFTFVMALLGAGAGLAVRAVAGARPGSVVYVGVGFLLSWVVGMVAFIFPSGLGVREGAFAAILSRHLPAAAAVSLAAASRLLLTAVELATVGALVGIERWRRRAAAPGRQPGTPALEGGPAPRADLEGPG